MRKKLLFVLSMCFLLVLTACGSEGASKDDIKVIKFADAGWDSIRVHNHIAQNIVEAGFGYETEVVSGTTAATFQALEQGDINVYMEAWTDNIKESYEKAIEEGSVIKTSTNFDDNSQGLYVPTYVIEGDKEKGIDAIAPDLKTVEDLAKYPELFKDPEDSKMGLIIGAPSSWAVSEHLAAKIETYGLDEMYNYLAPGSDAAIVASLTAAYSKGEPWVGYYWSPTWVTASYDLIRLITKKFFRSFLGVKHMKRDNFTFLIYICNSFCHNFCFRSTNCRQISNKLAIDICNINRIFVNEYNASNTTSCTGFSCK